MCGWRTRETRRTAEGGRRHASAPSKRYHRRFREFEDPIRGSADGRVEVFWDKKTKMPSKDEALPGRADKMPVPAAHYVNGARLEEPFPAGLRKAVFGLGCFWGAE